MMDRITVVVDTREQEPYSFDSDKVSAVRKALPAGDYSLVGLEERVAVERKSLTDFVSTVIRGRKRFHRELEKLSAYESACVVVECNFRDLVDDRYYTEEGRIRGQAVHLAAHYHDLDVLDRTSLHPLIAGYFAGYERFLKETGFQVVLSENRVCHRDFRYAGTNDKIGYLFGRPALVDIKTGDVAFWTAYQLAAYAACYPYPLARYGLRLFPEGRYKLIPFENKNDFSVFLAALTTANVKTQQQGGWQ